MAAKVTQYVTIIDKSNKVISNSRQFKNVFLEAKTAYQDRKAAIKAQKKVREEEELQKALRSVTLQEQSERGSTVRPGTSRRPSSQRPQNAGRYSPPNGDRPRAHREYSGASVTSSGQTTPREGATRGISLGEFNDQIYGLNGVATQVRRKPVPSPMATWEEPDPLSRGLIRTRTDLPMQQMRHPSQLARSRSADGIDMDLAYGEYHPESLVVMPEVEREKELKSLVTKCKMLLEEADCAGHSAKAIITHLQKNPDTLAAVGLTLAEISNIATKMAPGALAAIGKSAPAVMALLLSPQFLIAVGVSVGVTVIAIGGYKIVKRIKEKSANDEVDKHVGPGLDEAIDVHELDRIERWRRGVPESVVDDGGSVVSGTSVEGEFITPFAAQSMGHLPTKSTASGTKSGKKSSKEKDKESRKSEKKHRRRRSDGDDTSSVTSRDSKSTVKRSTTSKVTVVKKPSPLSRMFSSGTSVKK